MAKAKRRCTTRTVLQDFGPAKKVRTCRKVGKPKKLWCVFKGKAKIASSCHRKKSIAKRRARALSKSKGCRTRVKRGGKR